MPSVHADAAGDDAHGDPDLSLRDRPITLADIDRLLEISSDVDGPGPGKAAPIRAWRDDLTLVLEALTYARAILSADAAVLRHAGKGGAEETNSLVDDVPGLLGSAPDAEPSSHPTGGQAEPELSGDLFSRTDQLLVAHQEMAEVDLTSAFDVRGSLVVIEEQLAALTERQQAVETRLQEIRAAVIRQYQDGPGTARDQPA